MNTKQTLLALALGMGLVAGPMTTAHAEAPYQLSATQMDEVTAAGLTRFFEFSSTRFLEGFIFASATTDDRVVETETGSLTSRISVSSFGYRSFGSNIQRTGSFVLTTSFD